MNYQNQGLSYLPKQKAKVDDTDARFYNSWYHVKTKLSNCFIIINFFQQSAWDTSLSLQSLRKLHWCGAWKLSNPAKASPQHFIKYPWKFAGTYRQSSTERIPLWEKCLAQEHHPLIQLRLDLRPSDLEFCVLVIRPQHINPLTPKSDQHLISPYNITSESYIKVMRIKEMISD